MSIRHGATYQSVALGGLGTGCLDFCNDGRFRNLRINNNRTADRSIPLAPHSFVAVRAAGEDDVYLRRLQTSASDERDPYLLPHDGLQFQGLYPQADCNVIDPGAPLAVAFGAYSPVVPYDYEASSLPLLFVAIQLTNTTTAPLSVSAVLNWQNTCGQYGLEFPESLRPISRDVLITEEDWELAKGNEEGDNERRLHADTGRVVQTHDQAFYEGEIPPNALLFGDHKKLDQNEDSEYCVVSRWQKDSRITHMVWDPTVPTDEEAFWEQLAASGAFDSNRADSPEPRCGAVCSTFTLAPGESRKVEFIVSWYGARYEVGGSALGNFYTNASLNALAVAKAGLLNGAYYHASVDAWRHRLATAGFPREFVRRIIGCSDVLSTNALHARNGAFGLLHGQSDPRVNCVRDRWYWSMALLLFYPRLETEMLERTSQLAISEGDQRLILSEGLECLGAPEYVGVSAAQVEAGAGLVASIYRNFLLTGNLSAMAQLAPRVQQIMALLLTQDKNVDGFPDIQAETPGLDGFFASGLNVISAGIWLVALHACEALIEMRQLPATPLYRQARKRATQNFDRYFWNETHGYYTLYPKADYEMASSDSLNEACHVGQLTAVWMADVMGLDSVIPPSRLSRVLATLQAHNMKPSGLHSVTWPADTELTPEGPISSLYGVVPYASVRIHRASFQEVYPEIAPLLRGDLAGEGTTLERDESQNTSLNSRYDVAQLARWYLLIASPTVQMRLAEKRLILIPDNQDGEERREHTLITPRGFGRVWLHIERGKPFRCTVKFTMDIPLELTSIYLHLDDAPDDLESTFELAEGTVPIRVDSETDRGGAVVLQIHPVVKTPMSSFELRLEEREHHATAESEKRPWLPHWLR